MLNSKCNSNLNHINKNNKKTSLIVFVFLCLLWTISFFKVPIIGKIIDAIFFEFLFGYVKILIYLILLLMLCTWNFKNLFYTLFSKRKLLSYFLIILFLCLLLGVISYFLNNQYNYSKFKDFFIGKQKSFFNNWVTDNIDNLLDIKQSFLIQNKYAYGGFIGLLYVALTSQIYYFVMLFSLVILFIVFTFICILCWSDKVLNKLKIKITKNQRNIKCIKVLNKLTIKSDEKIENKKLD